MVTLNLSSNYFNQIQAAAAALQRGSKELAQVEELILSFLNNERDPELRSFFEGELAFHRGEARSALKHYLQAKNLPSISFFCYRACAFLFKEIEPRKSLDFAERALDLYPFDGPLLDLCINLPLEENDENRRSEWRRRLEELSSMESYDYPEIRENEHSSQGALDRLIDNSEPSSSSKTVVEEPYPLREERALEDLKKLAVQEKVSASKRELSTLLGVDFDAGKALESRIHHFTNFEKELLDLYGAQTSNEVDPLLIVLSGWDGSQTTQLANPLANAPTLLTEGFPPNTQGYFFHWNGCGIALNPGKGFLHHLHSSGRHISEIDCVIVTRPNENHEAALSAIYELNYQLNSKKKEHHLIRYYLEHNAYQKLAQALTPRFKQERESVHSLGFYLESPNSESISINPKITLRYFRAPESDQSSAPKSVALAFDLLRGDDLPPLTLGYLSGCSWSPFFVPHLTRADIIIAAVESTSPTDYQRIKHRDDALGYYGCFSLLEEISPKLLLLTELDGQNGDIRMELVRKMREEFQPIDERGCCILPAEVGFCLDLNSMRIVCGVSGEKVDPHHIRVLKTSDSFGRLQYLSPHCFV